MILSFILAIDAVIWMKKMEVPQSFKKFTRWAKLGILLLVIPLYVGISLSNRYLGFDHSFG